MRQLILTGMMTTTCVYVIAGLFFGAWFLRRGVEQKDAVAAASRWWVRCLWLPGCVLIWPWLAMTCVRRKPESGAKTSRSMEESR